MRNADKLKKIVNDNPELFESLADFDRTMTLPKLYRRKRIDATIDENVLRDFKEFCRKKGFNLSRKIENLMVEELERGG